MTRAWSTPKVLVLAVLYVLSELSSLGSVVDRDIWWHLRTGEWIVRQHAVPRGDPFAVSMTATTWTASSWLFDAGIYVLYRSCGLVGFAVYQFLLGGAILVALQWLTTRSIGRPYTGIALPALTFAAMAPLFTPRPDLLSILLYTIELTVLLSALEDGSRRRLWFLPPLFAVWANVHSDFVYGVLVLGLATVAQHIDRRLRPDAGPANSLPALALVTIASVSATLLTPYHMALYLTILGQGRRTAAHDVFGDLLSLQFRQPADWIVLGLALGAAAVAGLRTRHRTFMTILLAMSAYVSFRTSRDAWMLIVSAAAILSSPTPAKPTPKPPTSWIGRGAVGGVILLMTALLATGAWSTRPSIPRWEAAVVARFPVAAARVIEERRYGGVVYSPLDWGGYLLWRLPHLPIAIDGRIDLHGHERVARSIVTWAGGHGWATDRDLLAADLVVAPAENSLTALLHDGGRFDVVYNDDVAVVFVARQATKNGARDAKETP